MTAVEHGQIDDHATKQTSFAKTQEESGCDQTGVALDEAHAHADNAPADDERWQVVAGLEILQDKIGRDIHTDIWHLTRI